MTNNEPLDLAVLGLGAMGGALAAAALRAGHRTTVWNRSAGRSAGLVRHGATAATSAADAVRGGTTIVVCLLDHAAVHEVLDPVAGDLAGRTLINLTTTTPAEARELAGWAARAGAAYLDGGIMAIPAMIGQPGASVLYSGSAAVFEQCRPLLDQWGTSTYFGDDAGLASLYDLALLAGMYVMFAGFLQGAAMVHPAGVTAGEFAALAAPWLSAMTGALPEFAAVIDGGDYTVAGQQSIEFSDLGTILTTAADQGVSTEVIDVVQRLIRRQLDAGRGAEGFARIIEGLRAA